MLTYARSSHRWSCGAPRIHIVRRIDEVGGTTWTLCGELRWPTIVTPQDDGDICKKCLVTIDAMGDDEFKSLRDDVAVWDHPI